MDSTAAATSTTLLSIASPRPRRPNGGILVRSSSTDMVSAKRCVKWAQCQPQIFEIDSWDRSPCPVTPKLTYRDLVELKQLELDKVPHSPFKSLADLPMPIGLPRVRVGLQPIFDRPTPPTTTPSSSSSSTTSPSSSSSSGISSISSSSSSLPAPALHPSTPNTTPIPTPPRTESPQPTSPATSGNHTSSSSSSSSNGVTSLSYFTRNPPTNGNGNVGQPALMIRRSYASSSATNLAKAPSYPYSSSSPAAPPPSVPLPSTFTSPTPSRTSTENATVSATGSTCNIPSPLSLPPATSISTTLLNPKDVPLPTSPSSNKANDHAQKSGTGSHPALELASALLSQRTPSTLNETYPDPLRLRSPLPPTTSTPVTLASKNATTSPARKRLAPKMGGFQFMPLLPPTPPSDSPSESPMEAITPVPTPVDSGVTTPVEASSPETEEELSSATGTPPPVVVEMKSEEATVPVPPSTDTAPVVSEPHDDEDANTPVVVVEADHDDDDDDVVSRAASPADLIAIGHSSLNGDLHMPLKHFNTKLSHHSHHHHLGHGAPPSEADTDTESTLHSEFDHDHIDHLDHRYDDIDDQTTEVGFDDCYQLQDHNHEHEHTHEDVDGMGKQERYGDVEVEMGHEEPEEPDEPDEPDLRERASAMGTAVTELRVVSVESTTPTETAIDPVSPSSSTSSSGPPSPTPLTTKLPASAPSPPNPNTPAPQTLTSIASLISSAVPPSAVITDEDVLVRMQAAKAKARRPSAARADMTSQRVISPGKLGLAQGQSIGACAGAGISVGSPPASPVKGVSTKVSSTSSPILSPKGKGAGADGSAGSSAWEQVAW